jgi:hypothetical protein
MKTLLLVMVLLFTGCSVIPSFEDPNQSRAAVDIQYSIAQLNCDQPVSGQIAKIQENLQWFRLYSESKGPRQQDVLAVITPLEQTVNDFAQRSNTGSRAYCQIKKDIMTQQSARAARVILGRF